MGPRLHGLIKPDFVSHQTRWHNKNFSKRLFNSTGLFMDWKLQTETDFCKFITKQVSPNILRTEHYYSLKKKEVFQNTINGKKYLNLLMDVSFNCWKAGFEGDKATLVLKVTLLQICLFLYVCIRIKAISKTFLREAVGFLFKSMVYPLMNSRDVYKIFGIWQRAFIGKGRLSEEGVYKTFNRTEISK